MARILVMDDDLIYLDELAKGLRSLNHTVATASSGHEALEIIDRDPFDIAICDMIMTGGGALSFLHEVRSRNSKMPVIVITGRREIATSPLFVEGMLEASAKIEKIAPLSEIDKVIKSLLN
ncbi:response regulator [Actibacterium sp. 188UL27-1]|uniref:response regulator n=1 Tax=Actibacterium sp. 188UL27-1 TaxID=2786961 RepID=UPI00195E00AC|nr:response regulator [Actibacterium sp. 188UL27-1]MBM7070036.1 response regulator [Actibacterium sp. 188UL27-1]